MALKPVGALWKKQDKNKKDYLSGNLDLGALGEARIMVFPNEKKEGEQPDYRISLVADDKEE